MVEGGRSVAHTGICSAGQLETGLDSTKTILAHTHATQIEPEDVSCRELREGVGGWAWLAVFAN